MPRTLAKRYGNHVHHINGERTGIYLDAWANRTFNIEIYRNLLHDNSAGVSLASEMGGLLEHINIYNNVIYNNRTNGLEIGNWGEPGVTVRPIAHITFTNNTVYHNGSNDWGEGIQLENPNAQNVVVRNNIFGQNLLFQISNEQSGANLSVDHNLTVTPRSTNLRFAAPTMSKGIRCS